jgi:hypothetical protein
MTGLGFGSSGLDFTMTLAPPIRLSAATHEFYGGLGLPEQGGVAR